MRNLKNLSLSARLLSCIVLVAIGGVVATALALGNLNTIKVNGPIYNRIVQGKDLVADILPPPHFVVESYMVVLEMARATNRSEINTLAARLKELRGEYDVRHAFWKEEGLEEALRAQFLDRAHQPANTFYAQALNRYLPALLRGDRESAERELAALSTLFYEHRKEIVDVVKMAERRNSDAEIRAKETETRTVIGMITIFSVFAIVVALYVFGIRRVVTRSLDSVGKVVSDVAEGKLDNVVDASGPREIGLLMDSMQSMQRRLSRVVHETREAAQAAAGGDFSRRVNTDGMAGFQFELGESLNQLVQTAESGMKDVSDVLEALAEGDLTRRVEKDYQGLLGKLKDNVNHTSKALATMVSGIMTSTETINTASREIASANTDLSSRTEEQASSLEQTASSMEELSSTVKQNAENARQANQLAAGASEVAVRGGSVVGQVVQTMGGISDSSKKIADIIGVIDGIAFQTNILALNAAVEAARAGEQGRGFAVVATEVRNLAQRSATAAKEIKELITDSVGKVDMGKTLVDEAGKTMQEVVTSVKRVTDIMAEIATASSEQSDGIDQVSTAVGQMDEVTQQNAAMVEQSAAAAEMLEEQAVHLSQAVARFRIDGQADVHGRGEGSAAIERRGPNRATNVERLPEKSARNAKLVANGASSAAEARADDDWEEF